ncbi:unnamed protein product, partial [Rotaria sp. Silwood2]
MSSINYDNNNNNNEIPLQDPNAPPRLPRYIRRRGGVLGRNNDYDYIGRNNYTRRNNYVERNNNNYYREGNPFYYRNRGNQFYNQNYRRYPRNFYNRNFYNQNYRNRGNQFYNQNYRRYPRNYYPRNNFYNRNNRIPRQNFNPYYRGRYGFVNPGQERQERLVQPVRSPSRRRLSNRPRRQGPRQIRLNDFMPTELREPSPQLPPDFNIATTTALAITNTNAPPDALPQRERFVRNNTTQPFTVSGSNQNQQQQQQRQRKTTSSFRRRQRRNNRFAMLADENDNLSDVEAEVKDDSKPLNTNKKLRKVKNSKKTSRYLEPTRILKWLEDHSRSSKNAISSRGNQAYVLASASSYDNWVRNN